MKEWIVKNFSHSWDSKVFGTKFRHLRAVNITMPVFCICIALILTLEDLYGVLYLNPFASFLILTPFWLCVYLGFPLLGMGYFRKNPSRFEDLDWEQKWQHLNLPFYLKKKEIIKDTEILYQELETKYIAKYGGPEKFVEAWRFFKPLAFMFGLMVYYILLKWI